MNKIIILSWEFNGTNSTNANSICVSNIINNSKFKSDIIVITGGLEIKEEKLIIDEVEVYSIPKLKTTIKNELINFRLKAMKIISDIINDKSDYIVFAVSFPFEVLILGMNMKLKYNNVKLFVYELDPYSYNKALRIPIIGFPYRFAKERRIFEQADMIFLTNELFKSYQKNIFKKFKAKFVDLGIPILNICNELQTNESEDECRIVYAGSLSRKYRDPSYMLELFVSIKKLDIWSLHLYGVNIDEIDKHYLEMLKGKLFIHRKLPRKEILKVIKKSSILLNIGNIMDNQLPSKLLDYIGFRKPIINIYNNINDTSKIYLSDYPIKFQVNANNKNLKVDSNKLIDFIITNYNKHCSYSDVKNNYNKYSIDTIVENLDFYFKNSLEKSIM